MRRDVYGIIIQTDANNPSYEDGGDSAFSTGLMAFCKSRLDLNLMRKFITQSLELVRHPFQSFNTGTHPHNDPRTISRDQTIAFYAGLPNLADEDSNAYDAVKAACLIQAKKWWCNQDIMTPDVRGYLYLCAGADIPLLLKPFAYLFMYASLLWSCFIKPDHEMNQSICKCVVYGEWWITKLYKWHPDLTGNVHEYFDGWRDKKEIGDRLILKIASTIKS